VDTLRAAERVEGRNVGMKSFVVGSLLALALMSGAVAEDARNVNIVNETGYGIKFLGFNNPGDDDWSDNELACSAIAAAFTSSSTPRTTDAYGI
jgi:opacity protein-like surface antigen